MCLIRMWNYNMLILSYFDIYSLWKTFLAPSIESLLSCSAREWIPLKEWVWRGHWCSWRSTILVTQLQERKCCQAGHIATCFILGALGDFSNSHSSNNLDLNTCSPELVRTRKFQQAAVIAELYYFKYSKGVWLLKI